MACEPFQSMKTTAATISLLALLLAATPAGAQGAFSGVESLRLIETNLPVFPFDLIQLGVREGEVRIAFSVDANGKIEDCLAVAYTHPEFARVTLAAVKRWKFEPARYHGQPIAAATEVSVKFEVEGTVVVSLTPTETLNARLFSLIEGRDTFRPRTLNEIDRIPTPISTQMPAFPMRLANSTKVEHVTVTFYIDETGAVRLPSVDVNQDPELSAVAIEALRHWKFEPPTYRKRPVLVRASQQFNFAPQKKADTAGSNG